MKKKKNKLLYKITKRKTEGNNNKKTLQYEKEKTNKKKLVDIYKNKNKIK